MKKSIRIICLLFALLLCFASCGETAADPTTTTPAITTAAPGGPTGPVDTNTLAYALKQAGYKGEEIFPTDRKLKKSQRRRKEKQELEMAQANTEETEE